MKWRIVLLTYFGVLLFGGCKKDNNVNQLQPGSVYVYNSYDNPTMRLFSISGEIKDPVLVNSFYLRHPMLNLNVAVALNSQSHDTIKIVTPDSLVMTENAGWGLYYLPFKTNYNGDVYYMHSVKAGISSVDTTWERLFKYFDTRLYYYNSNGTITSDFYFYFSLGGNYLNLKYTSIGLASSYVRLMSHSGLLDEKNIYTLLKVSTDTVSVQEYSLNYKKI